MDLHTHGLHRPGLLTKWENERDEVSFDPDKITDAQWAVCAKVQRLRIALSVAC